MKRLFFGPLVLLVAQPTWAANAPFTEGLEPLLHMEVSSPTELITSVGEIVHYDYILYNVNPQTLHDVSIDDPNVDAPPVCAFSGDDELTPEGDPGSVVICTAQHTVTQPEIDGGGTLETVATATYDEGPPFIAELSIPIGLHLEGFEERFEILTLDLDGRLSSMAIDSSGLPVMSYRPDSSQSLAVVKCITTRCPAASISVVDESSDTGWGSSIAIGNDGFPVISYYDLTNNSLKVAKCNDAACKFGDETISTVDTIGVSPITTSIAIGDDGMPVISYNDSAIGRLKVAKCNDPACSGADEMVTIINDFTDFTGVFSSVVIGTDTFPVISYQQSTGPSSSVVRVAKCNDTACAGQDETISDIEGAGGTIVEAQKSIVIGQDGFPVLAYFDSSESAIKVVKCNDASCSGDDELISALDSVTGTQRVGMVIGSTGFPIVAYTGLRVAACNDVACAGGDEPISQLDNAAGAALTSMVLGPDELPIIGYFINVEGLKIVQCTSVSCQ